MAVSIQNNLWHRVTELTKVAQQKGVDPLLWAIQLSSNLNSVGVVLLSVELANLLVSHICCDNDEPVSWKFLEKALMLNIVPPILVLALLTTRVISRRQFQAVAYRLYLELLRRHAFKLKPRIHGLKCNESFMIEKNNEVHAL